MQDALGRGDPIPAHSCDLEELGPAFLQNIHVVGNLIQTLGLGQKAREWVTKGGFTLLFL